MKDAPSLAHTQIIYTTDVRKKGSANSIFNGILTDVTVAVSVRRRWAVQHSAYVVW